LKGVEPGGMGVAGRALSKY